MFVKPLLVSTAIATGLLMLEAAEPALSGATAQAAQVKQQRPVSRPVVRAAPQVRAAPRASFHGSTVVRSTRGTVVRSNRGTVVRTNRTTTINRLNVNRTNLNVRTNPNLRVNPNLGRRLAPGATQALVRPGALRLGPAGAGPRLAPGPVNRLRPGTVVTLNNRVWPIHTGRHRIWWGGGWRTFLPFTALGAVLIGGAYYYPSAYISVARPYCSGITPDGCQLNWQLVGFEGGGEEWQCVEYCARPELPPPPQAVALVPPPPVAAGGRCELTIFAEPGFGGLSAPTSEDQPRLVEAGWKNQIASLQVQAGTWDFFSEDEFTGENMRLAPGSYPQLGQEWTKHIGSFMCVQGN